MEGRAPKWMMGSSVRAPPSTRARRAKVGHAHLKGPFFFKDPIAE